MIPKLHAKPMCKNRKTNCKPYDIYLNHTYSANYMIITIIYLFSWKNCVSTL